MTERADTRNDLLPSLRSGTPAAWLRRTVAGADALGLADGAASIADARDRFARFCWPLAMLLGADGWNGEIRSDLLDWSDDPDRTVLVKADHALPMTGSIKARGGVHELLKYIEDIALAEGLIAARDDDYAVLAGAPAHALFAGYEVSVASTGNLGFSIGLVGRAFGLRATVHMSHDAKAWKKERLRNVGATVIEHAGDYGEACAAARAAIPADRPSRFVDDESSPDLFWGYAVAAGELADQLAARGIVPSPERPLVVYLPCGVGGAPGGITYGLKLIYGQAVICVFVEPTSSPCMLAALALGTHDGVPPSVYELGLDNRTVADGLAVARASPLVLAAVGEAIDAAVSVSDEVMLAMAADAWHRALLRLEPSAAASLAAIPQFAHVFADRADWPDLANATHVAWATGGSMLPDAEWATQLAKGNQSMPIAMPAG